MTITKQEVLELAVERLVNDATVREALVEAVRREIASLTLVSTKTALQMMGCQPNGLANILEGMGLTRVTFHTNHVKWRLSDIKALIEKGRGR